METCLLEFLLTFPHIYREEISLYIAYYTPPTLRRLILADTPPTTLRPKSSLDIRKSMATYLGRDWVICQEERGLSMTSAINQSVQGIQGIRVAHASTRISVEEATASDRHWNTSLALKMR